MPHANVFENPNIVHGTHCVSMPLKCQIGLMALVICQCLWKTKYGPWHQDSTWDQIQHKYRKKRNTSQLEKEHFERVGHVPSITFHKLEKKILSLAT